MIRTIQTNKKHHKTLVSDLEKNSRLVNRKNEMVK